MSKDNKNDKTYHSKKSLGFLTRDSDKEVQDKFYNECLAKKFKRFNIEPDCDINSIYDVGED